MNKSFAYVVGVICGILAVFIVALIVRAIVKKNSKKSPTEYDERQIQARGKSYKTGFLTFIITTLVLTLLETLDVHFAEYPLLFLMDLLVGAFAFVTDAIFRDAYFKMGESRNLWWFPLIGVINILMSFVNCKNGFISENGLLYMDTLNMIVGIWIIIIYILCLIKKGIDKKADKADAE